MTTSPPLHFKTETALRQWLVRNHAASDGIWLRFFKKVVEVKAVTRAEALDQALCFGWIDGQAKPLDESSWIQRFTPRRAKSGWSKINTEHIERLTQAGLMTAAGLREVEAAKKDGRWEKAYPSPKNAVPPEDFLRELARNKKAKAFFESLNRANIYAIVYRLHTAKKPGTREKRMQVILEMMAEGKKFHP